MGPSQVDCRRSTLMVQTKINRFPYLNILNLIIAWYSKRIYSIILIPSSYLLFTSLSSKEISAFWDKKKTLQQNLKDMGLAYDANRSVKMPGKEPAAIEEVVIKAKVPEVLECE